MCTVSLSVWKAYMSILLLLCAPQQPAAITDQERQEEEEQRRMETVLLTIIAASGLCAVSSNVHREYHFIYERKNWTEAEEYCKEKYTDLATIDSMEDVNILLDMVDLNQMPNSDDNYRNRAWIGLYDDLHSWRWSLSNGSFYKDGETEFRRWKSGEPNNKAAGENCTWMYDNGMWNDNSCTVLLKAVCMDVRGPNVTFILTDQSMNWTEAQSLCRARYTDLASVRNMEDNQKVNELVPSGEKVWIGLFREFWEWSDGSSSPFRNWKLSSNEPNNYYQNEACTVADLTESGEWEDWPCDRMRAFICHSVSTGSKHVVKVRLSKESSSLNLNDPAVMEGILKQLRQKLKDQGLDDGIKVSWRKQPDGKVFHKEEEETKKRNARRKRAEL